MPTQEQRAALPFSEAERLFQGPPYVYTSGTVPVTEKDAEYIFYQTWTDARVEQRNADVSPPKSSDGETDGSLFGFTD